MRSFLVVVLALFLAAFVIADDPVATYKGKTIIGIDLGTTYSCVGVYRNGKVEIIPNEQGNRITPSMVSFTEDGLRLIGDAARNQQFLNPKNTFYDVKRLVGRKYSDVLRDASMLTFELVNQNGKPYIKGNLKGKDTLFSPEEISAMILGKMKEIAEKYLGETVEYAVITVPAYFNDAQRQATKDAGAIAGLEVVRIINEPTAASMAYGLNKTEENILVFDLGGGTHDVTLLTIADDVFEVKATNGDTHLGGEDFDHNVVDHFMKIFKAKSGKDLSVNKRAVAKLKQAVEAAKRTLSSQVETRIEIEALHDGVDFSELLTRAKFEELNMDLFKKSIKPVENVLADSKLKKNEIDEVVIVGGSTRIPKIRELLSDYFGGKELHKEINPDEAIAYGAAVQAGALAGVLKNVVLIDVTPLTLGFETVGGVMTKMIPRNSKIPIDRADVFTTVEDYQTTLVVDVYEGERGLTKHNRLLGSFELKDLPPARAGVPQIEVKFHLDQNGILTVVAKDMKTGRSEKIQIQKGTLDAADVEKFTQDAKDFAEEDKKALERVTAKNEVDLLLQNSKTRLEDLKDKISAKDKTRVEEHLEKLTDWTFDNQDAEPKEWKRKAQDLERLVDPIFRKLVDAAASEEQKKDEL